MRRPESWTAGAVPSALGTAAVALLWGTSGAFVRFLDLPAAEIACLRAALGAVAVSAWLVLRNRSFRMSLPRAGLRALLISGVLLAVHWLTFVMALQRAPIGTVLTGIYLAPIVVAALARRTLGERVSGTTLLTTVAAVAGSALVLRPGETGGWTGVATILVSALTYAGSILAGKKALRTSAPLVVASGQLGVTAIVLAPLLLIDVEPLSVAAAGALLLLGVVYSAVAMVVYLVSLRGISATSSAILLCLEPVAGFGTGWALFGERPHPLTVVGALTVLAAGTLVTVGTTRADASRAPHPPRQRGST
ncbi:DMT family transporter [Actinoplanes sp. NPDC051494]|uniref:DMT family transporter n=1 Tax=Actinoplanes sp. NPDC051494 TaxID=3363907 RepID=UPI00379563B3